MVSVKNLTLADVMQIIWVIVFAAWLIAFGIWAQEVSAALNLHYPLGYFLQMIGY